MPANLAVLDVDGAEGITEKYGDVESWYMAGHSLGGSMAASYLGDQLEAAEGTVFDGLILLASYSAVDLSDTDLEIISIYGSEDGVLNREKYDNASADGLWPSDFTEKVIEGGNHAQFGSYGVQKGDGSAKISADEQIEITAEKIAEFIRSGDYKKSNINNIKAEKYLAISTPKNFFLHLIEL
jgi:pimeloyl-ACP methyl ester carboxylesterase